MYLVTDIFFYNIRLFGVQFNLSFGSLLPYMKDDERK